MWIFLGLGLIACTSQSQTFFEKSECGVSYSVPVDDNSIGFSANDVVETLSQEASSIATVYWSELTQNDQDADITLTIHGISGDIGMVTEGLVGFECVDVERLRVPLDVTIDIGNGEVISDSLLTVYAESLSTDLITFEIEQDNVATVTGTYADQINEMMASGNHGDTLQKVGIYFGGSSSWSWETGSVSINLWTDAAVASAWRGHW